jgi:cell division septation protein DedD
MREVSGYHLCWILFILLLLCSSVFAVQPLSGAGPATADPPSSIALHRAPEDEAFLTPVLPDTEFRDESLDSTKYVVEYAIQVGAFSVRKNADKLKRKLRSAGYRVDIYPNILDRKQTLYLVWVGTYKNAVDAEPDRAAILERFRIDGVIRPRTAAQHR